MLSAVLGLVLELALGLGGCFVAWSILQSCGFREWGRRQWKLCVAHRRDVGAMKSQRMCCDVLLQCRASKAERWQEFDAQMLAVTRSAVDMYIKSRSRYSSGVKLSWIWSR